MLGDIVLHSTFPADELERERQVILHELTEDEEDPAGRWPSSCSTGPATASIRRRSR